jgi:predicted transcriptional regulator
MAILLRTAFIVPRNSATIEDDHQDMKYRSRTEIMAQMLLAANKGATKSRIMYSALLSYSQLKEYLTFLQSKDLLMYEQGSGLYRLTERGLRFIDIYDKISQSVSVEPTDMPAKQWPYEGKLKQEPIYPGSVITAATATQGNTTPAST